MFPLAVALVLGLFAFSLTSAQTRAPTRRLTTSGDVIEFVWAPDGKGLYVTREGKNVQVDARRQQITGDLYRVDAVSGAEEPVARNANSARVPMVGDEIAYTRLNDDGTAQTIVSNPRANQELDMGRVTFGAVPQWNREGGTLFFVEGDRLRRSTRTERGTAFAPESFPTNALVSSRGDRVAFVDLAGLWVTQGEKGRIVASENGVRVLPQIAWSKGGDKLAYVMTHEGFDPQLWVADTVRNETKLVAKGSGLEYFSNPAWSPDDAYLIFTRTPTGSSGAGNSEIWRARSDGTEAIALTTNNAEETLPQYSNDGTAIAFMRDGELWVMELNGNGLPQADASPVQIAVAEVRTPRATNAQRTPPATIRVRHDAANVCRSVPLGQIDTIDFEEYVKRVVAAEVYSSWDADALKTQAVAARSYSWYWVLQHTASAFDVTDTTSYQYMCDTQYASTDNATEATRGQYLDYVGFMVFAAYGAENGDPTLSTTWGSPYLHAVDDPVGFLKTRAGNGFGYSQWGAQRWATLYDWNYQQILLHYYSNVTVQAPAGTGNDIASPIGAIVAPWQNWGVASTHVQLVVNASDEFSGIDRIELWAQYQAGDGAHNEVIATLHGAERAFLWDVTSLPNQNPIRVTPILYDDANHSNAGAGIVFELDRKKPQGALAAPATTTSRNITLNPSGSDAGGGAVATMMFSNDWEWQGESQLVEPNSASVVNDPDALNGRALRAQVGVHPAGTWYGPYTSTLPSARAYRAYFRLKTDNATFTDDVALLDVVVDGGARILGMKQVRGSDFKGANEYQEFFVEFYYDGFSTNALEFRTAYRANASLWLDRILVVRYPIPYAASAPWTLTPGEGNKRVIAKFADRVGNVSPDAVSTVYYGQNPPPVLTPRGWLPLILSESQ